MTLQCRIGAGDVARRRAGRWDSTVGHTVRVLLRRRRGPHEEATESLQDGVSHLLARWCITCACTWPPCALGEAQEVSRGRWIDARAGWARCGPGWRPGARPRGVCLGGFDPLCAALRMPTNPAKLLPVASHAHLDGGTQTAHNGLGRWACGTGGGQIGTTGMRPSSGVHRPGHTGGGTAIISYRRRRRRRLAARPETHRGEQEYGRVRLALVYHVPLSAGKGKAKGVVPACMHICMCGLRQFRLAGRHPCTARTTRGWAPGRFGKARRSAQHM